MYEGKSNYYSVYNTYYDIIIIHFYTIQFYIFRRTLTKGVTFTA